MAARSPAPPPPTTSTSQVKGSPARAPVTPGLRRARPRRADAARSTDAIPDQASPLGSSSEGWGVVNATKLVAVGISVDGASHVQGQASPPATTGWSNEVNERLSEGRARVMFSPRGGSDRSLRIKRRKYEQGGGRCQPHSVSGLLEDVGEGGN